MRIGTRPLAYQPRAQEMTGERAGHLSMAGLIRMRGVRSRDAQRRRVAIAQIVDQVEDLEAVTASFLGNTLVNPIDRIAAESLERRHDRDRDPDA